MEDDHHYHKLPPQDDHLSPWSPECIKERKGDSHIHSGDQTDATAVGYPSQTIVSGVP